MLGSDAVLRKSLVAAADLLANKIRSTADSNGLPKAVSNSVSTGQVESTSDGKLYVNITVDLKTAPMAAAYEYGSGLWRTIGTPSKYIIEPVDADALAFEWPNYWEAYANSPNPDPDPLYEVKRSPKFIAYLPDTDTFLFRWVEHPGVKARPYIKPSILASMSQIKTMIGEAFKVTVTNMLKETVSTIEIEYDRLRPNWEYRIPSVEPVTPGDYSFEG